ncbi:MAG: penicillin-binding protein [Fibrobacteraceae bacterium]|nr:penicillin-binding protein [Fibrobacteraceae bacterium]
MRPLPYPIRIFNRFLVAALFILFVWQIGSCIFSETENSGINEARNEFEIKDSMAQQTSQDTLDLVQNNKFHSQIDEEEQKELIQENRQSIAAAVAPTNAPVAEIIDSTHILKQKNVFLAQQIDKYLRRFKPKHAVYLIVDLKSNEIMAWGEVKDGVVQNEPDYLSRNTFPAASVAKTVTMAAALESRRYNLESPIPAQGKSTHLYKSQLRVKEPYIGPTLTLREVYAHSANPSMAIVGYKLGANKLKQAAKMLGYNARLPGFENKPLKYAPPDSGYGLYEVASGFTEEVTLSPIVAAAQMRSFIAQKPLEIPWSPNLKGFAPDKPYALNLPGFSVETCKAMKEAMIATVTIGSARKRISKRNMARKSLENLIIGGKTGNKDGSNPEGRYEWFAGFAQSKENPSKGIIVSIMQVYGEMRTQSSADVAAILINHWAREYVN